MRYCGSSWAVGPSRGETERKAAAELLVRCLTPLVPALAAMHKATARLLRQPPVADVTAPVATIDQSLLWILRLVDGDCPAELWANPLVADVLSQILGRAELVAGLRRARAAWFYRCWFHAAPIHEDALAPVTWPTRAEYRTAALPFRSARKRLAGRGGWGSGQWLTMPRRGWPDRSVGSVGRGR